MATPKSAPAKGGASKPATAKAATAASTKPAPPRGIPAPSIKAAAVVVPTISVVSGPLNSDDGPSATAAAGDGNGPVMLKKQELVERIVKASGAKKKDVKLIVEAALGVLGDALSAGEELNLPPLGKMKVNRQREEGNAEILILKLRRGGGQGGGGNGVAKDDDADDGDDD
ncbi:HU family DNA-binding protein [Pseudorhodobacter ferrugineus]|uniref:HU family DNA-binding protein n=1 Tax=Pseudorhodobacter ferrugineus TaxID=77008 RepID=UPI0003B67133|nr:HU family DNA-binding protein [Pseudorhodobacter ferrugineus]